MTDFLTAKSIQFGKCSSRRLKTRWGISQCPGKSSTRGAAERWPGSVMAFPTSGSQRVPEATQPQWGRPHAPWGRCSLGRDGRTCCWGRQDGHSGPTPWPWVLPRVLLQQHNRLPTDHPLEQPQARPPLLLQVRCWEPQAPGKHPRLYHLPPSPALGARVLRCLQPKRTPRNAHPTPRLLLVPPQGRSRPPRSSSTAPGAQDTHHAPSDFPVRCTKPAGRDMSPCKRVTQPWLLRGQARQGLRAEPRTSRSIRRGQGQSRRGESRPHQGGTCKVAMLPAMLAGGGRAASAGPKPALPPCPPAPGGTTQRSVPLLSQRPCPAVERVSTDMEHSCSSGVVPLG